jgi:DNA-binding MarR family transcriptional regulator
MKISCCIDKQKNNNDKGRRYIIGRGKSLKSQKRIDFVVANYGKMSIKQIAESLNVNKDYVRTLITKHVRPGWQKKYNNPPPSKEMIKFIQYLVISIEMARKTNYQLTLNEIITKTLIYCHSNSRRSKN